MNLGDIRLGETIDFKFTTISSTGAPTTLAGSPAVAVYVGNGTTEITAGVTLTVDFDSRTGLHNVRIVASSGNGFATATNCVVVLTAGTVDGVSVVGYVLAHFSIEARSAYSMLSDGTNGLAAMRALVDDLESRLTATRAGNLDNLDATVSSRLATAGYTAPLSAAGVRTAVGLGAANLDAQLDALPTAAENATQVRTELTTELGRIDATVSSRATPAQVNTEVDAALVDIHLDHLLAADYDPGSKPGVATALLNELVESDAGVSRFTANALEQAPSGGGGGVADWTAGEREQIRHRLGIDGTAAAPSATPSLATAAAVNDLPTNAELATALAGLNNLSAADIRTAVGLATNNLDAQLAAKSTSAEVAAVAAAIAALPNAAAIATALLDAADAIETGVTPRIALRAILAMVAGEITGAETTTPTITNPAGTATRVTMTTDADGNRNNVVLS